MNITEIPLTAENQLFAITLADNLYRMRILWRDSVWNLDLLDSDGTLIIGGIPLIASDNLLAQYAYLRLNFALRVVCDVVGNDNPTQTDLGQHSHLYVVTE